MALVSISILLNYYVRVVHFTLERNWKNDTVGTGTTTVPVKIDQFIFYECCKVDTGTRIRALWIGGECS